MAGLVFGAVVSAWEARLLLPRHAGSVAAEWGCSGRAAGGEVVGWVFELQAAGSASAFVNQERGQEERQDRVPLAAAASGAVGNPHSIVPRPFWTLPHPAPCSGTGDLPGCEDPAHRDS